MDLPEIYNDPILSKKRKGSADSPFQPIKETLYVDQGRAVLTEIPNRGEKVIVTGYKTPIFEVQEGSLKPNTYKVDYVEGVVFFHGDLNKASLTFEYLGEGRHFFPASGIWIQRKGNEVLATLQEFVDRADKSVVVAEKAGAKAGAMATWAQEVTSDYETMMTETKKIYKPALANFQTILQRYPEPEIGWTVEASETRTEYRWDGYTWVNIGSVDSGGLDVIVSPTEPNNVNKLWLKLPVNETRQTRIVVSNTEPTDKSKLWLRPMG